MTTGALLWCIAFGIAALVFFGIALAVSIRGMRDLRDLLGLSARGEKRS
jgi:hypothetical protein